MAGAAGPRTHSGRDIEPHQRARAMLDNWKTTHIPLPLPEDPHKHFPIVLQKFNPQDIVWNGREFSTGKEAHTRFFMSARERLNLRSCPDQFTCPAAFQPGSYSRCNSNIATRRFLVVESDSLGHSEFLAVVFWATQFLDLRLIIDTANKSLHAWFNFPPADTLAQLKILFPAMGCDSKMFGASQPCRCPGALRDGRYQTLIYADKEVSQ